MPRFFHRPAAHDIHAPSLELEGVSVAYDGIAALEDVSFSVRQGDQAAVIGPNGAGKSTLMKILSGATAPDSGNILFEGQAYHPRDPHAARLAGVSMIYQELTIAPDLSIEDNILLGCESSRWGLLDRTAQRQRMREAISLLGLTGYPLHWPARKVSPGVQQLIEIARALVIGELSGGQQQRLARALAQRPNCSSWTAAGRAGHPQPRSFPAHPRPAARAASPCSSPPTT